MAKVAARIERIEMATMISIKEKPLRVEFRGLSLIENGVWGKGAASDPKLL
jgi:hypothetical protein